MIAFSFCWTVHFSAPSRPLPDVACIDFSEPKHNVPIGRRCFEVKFVETLRLTTGALVGENTSRDNKLDSIKVKYHIHFYLLRPLTAGGQGLGHQTNIHNVCCEL